MPTERNLQPKFSCLFILLFLKSWWVFRQTFRKWDYRYPYDPPLLPSSSLPAWRDFWYTRVKLKFLSEQLRLHVQTQLIFSQLEFSWKPMFLNVKRADVWNCNRSVTEEVNSVHAAHGHFGSFWNYSRRGWLGTMQVAMHALWILCNFTAPSMVGNYHLYTE